MDLSKWFEMRRTLALAGLLGLLAPGGLSAQDVTLPVGRTESRKLKGGETHGYALRLEAGQYAKVLVMQRGVDVVVTALSPKGVKLAEVDSPNGTQGQEPLEIRATESGEYRVSVQSLEPHAEAGPYDIRIETLLTAEEYRTIGIVQVPLKAMLTCSGAFELEPGHVIATGVVDEIGARLVYTDLRSGRFGVLNPHSETEFMLGPTVLSEYPVSAFLTFKKGPAGEILGVDIKEGGKSRFAKKIGPARSEEVSFQREGLTFKGVLHLPVGKGPFPTLVYAHGSGPATRLLGHYPAYFNSLGFAVLAFDKRGAGQSQGDWRTASLHALADDVLAGVEFLRTRPDIHPKKIGVFGISQGGWVSSLVAAKAPSIAFQVVLVGSGVPVWENVAHETRSVMRDAGVSGEALNEGHAFAGKVFKMATDGASPEAMKAAIDAQRGKPWLSAIWLAQAPPDSPWWAWFKLNGAIDPMEILPKIQCPVLWLLGDRDSQVPTAESEPRIRAAFKKGGNQKVTVKTFKHAGHPLLECETGLQSEFPTLKRFVPGLYDTLTPWLLAQAKN